MTIRVPTHAVILGLISFVVSCSPSAAPTTEPDFTRQIAADYVKATAIEASDRVLAFQLNTDRKNLRYVFVTTEQTLNGQAGNIWTVFRIENHRAVRSESPVDFVFENVLEAPRERLSQPYLLLTFRKSYDGDLAKFFGLKATPDGDLMWVDIGSLRSGSEDADAGILIDLLKAASHPLPTLHSWSIDEIG